MSFEVLDLHAQIIKAVKACGYTTPTPIQAQSIPVILEGKDIVASAQTGTGKTAAFVLPALHRLATQEASKKTNVLILTPTRELAAQITKAAMEYGKFLRFNIVNLVGGMPYHQQIRELSRGANIIVATPGRLLDHMENQRVDLSHVYMLVLDEADRMLDMGFIEDVEEIASSTPTHRQTLLFSATVDKKLATVVRHLLKHPVRIDTTHEKLTVPQIEQRLYKVNNPHQKSDLLKHFLQDESIYKAIIFTATKISADKLADRLCEQGFAAAALHGDLRQNVRNRTVDQLRRGKIQFLVATDVAARGIDISDVTHVINYDLPRFCEDYVHRIGRTGRAGKSGIAISFVLPIEMKHLQRIERYLGQRFKLMSYTDTDAGTGTSAGAREVSDVSHERSHFKDRDHHDKTPAKKKMRDHHKKGFSNKDRDRQGYQHRKGGSPFADKAKHKERKSNFESREEKSEFRSRETRRGFKPREERGDFRSREARENFKSREAKDDFKPRTKREDGFKKRFKSEKFGRDETHKKHSRDNNYKKDDRKNAKGRFKDTHRENDSNARDGRRPFRRGRSAETSNDPTLRKRIVNPHFKKGGKRSPFDAA